MQKITFTLSLIVCLLFSARPSWAQKEARLQMIRQQLEELSEAVPGLKQNVQLQMANVPLREYLSALAKANKLSISLDPQLNATVSETINGVSAANILYFFADKYNLDIQPVGTIIYIKPYLLPAKPQLAGSLGVNARYNRLENALSLELNNDSITAVAKKVSDISGKNVIVPAGLQGKHLNGFIASAPFDAAMDKLAFVNELKMIKTGDNFYLFQPLAESEELYINGDRNTDTRRVYKPLPLNPGGGGATGLYTKMVNGQKLISADAVNAPIADLVRQASQELNRSYSLYSELKGNLTIHISDVTYDNFLTLLFKGTDFTYHVENGIYLMGDSKLEGLRTSKVIQLQNRSIDTIVTMIPADWKRGIEIKEFREQNAILLSGASARIREVEDYIRQLDVLVPVVLIEVTLVDVHHSRSIATGLSLGVADSVKTGGTVLPGMDFTFSASSINGFLDKIGSVTSVNLGHVVPNFYARLKALETNSNVEVRSVPKLTALNGHTANLSIGNKIYYKNSTQNLIPSATTTVNTLTYTYTPTEANLQIGIKPQVAGDDQVTLGIKIDISDFTSIPTDGSPPPTATSKFESSIRVNNEDMIVLGGIERTEKSDGGSGFPLLSRIPILKWIFSSRNKSNSKIVTLVFIKPTILR